MKNLAIYIHIPFCKQRCYYCDFCSSCGGEKEQKRYFKLLEEEILFKSQSFQGRSISSIYFGGGTPSFVDEKYIISVLNLINSVFKVKDDAEITIECNPCSTTYEKLCNYKNAGFNRISFGVQTFNDKILKRLGRIHTSKEAKKAVKLAKNSGFDNISCDLMIGVPFQKEKDLLKDVKKLTRLGVNHISSYMLQIEENTPLKRMVEQGTMLPASEEKTVEMYEKLVYFLERKGFFQYEISNFAKNETFSKHNLNYWKRGEYLGFGLSASSFVNETRFSNANTFKEYQNREIANFEVLTNREIIEEKVMLGLRCLTGVDLDELKKLNFDVVNNPKIQEMICKKLLIQKNNNLYCNPKFYSINNSIICEVLKDI